ncbi:MAG: NHL repeat-containing protein [Gaiella sp.]|nr:NHL repeat-containing protein [Gaiella sp.]
MRLMLSLLAVLCATFAVAATAGSNATGGSGYKLAGSWGKTGTGTGQFTGTGGLAVDARGNVYVADRDNNRVQVFSPSGSFLRKWGSIGGGNGQFTGADDIAVSPDGSIWVADDGGSRFQQFSSVGAFQTAVTLTSELARGVAVDANGDLLGAVEGSAKSGFRRFTAGSWAASGGLFGGRSLMRADDVEVSPDRSIYLIRAGTQGGGDWLERYSAGGHLQKKTKLGGGEGTRALAVDLDCNVLVSDWTTAGGFAKYSPSGKKLATAGLPYVTNDLAVGPKGDVYAKIQNQGIVRLAEDRSKPRAALVAGRVPVTGGAAKVKYTLSGVACPAQVSGVASLSGAVTGKAAVKVAAGKSTVLSIPARGSSGKAQFKIVLKTNGRPTTQVASVNATVR